MMSKLEEWTTVGFLIGVLVLQGCTHGQRQETEETAGEVAEETGEIAGQVAEETQEVADRAEDMIDLETTARIQPTGGAELDGDADLSFQDGQVRVEVELATGTGGGDYTAMIHEGSCAAVGGPVVTLERFVSEGNGLESTTTFSADRLTDQARYAVVIHGASGAMVGCGDFGEIDRG